MEGFKILSKIGEGSYSTVLRVQRIADGNIYALKRVKFVKLSEKERLNALNEIRILASVKDKNVISYKEAFFDEKDSSLGIVMEYADKGDLFQLITERKKTKTFFKEPEIWKTFIQLLKGLKSLHELKILHRDIKSANVFLFKGGIVKLGDLNVSKVARKGLGYTQTGTPYYASPEVWKDKPYDSKSDIWSLGCVIYEMTTLRPPFQAQSMEELYRKVIRGIYPKISSKYSEDLNDVLKLMIQVEVGARPSCDELLKMPIISKRIEYFNENNDLEISLNDDESMAKSHELLKTITVPMKLENLGKNLPKPNYNTDSTNKSFQNNNKIKINQQYGSLTIANSEQLPNLYRKNAKESQITGCESNGSDTMETNEKSIGSIRQKKYYINEKIAQSVPKNSNSNKLNNGINKGIVLPNLYNGKSNNLYSGSPKNIGISVKNKRDAQYKVLNSENNVVANNYRNIKIIDGGNIFNQKKGGIYNNNSCKKNYQIYPGNEEIAKILLDKGGIGSGNKQINYKNNKYNERNFYKMLQLKKKSNLVYLGKNYV